MTLLQPQLCEAQKEFGFLLPNKVKRVTIPFEFQNNLIIIPITVNRFITLKFILDTGVETAILTEKLFADLMGLEYVRSIAVDAPGIADSVEAFVATGVEFSITDRLNAKNMNLLVLKEDYLKLSQSVGENIHGIIGYDLFRRFIVGVDYDRKMITFSKFNQHKKYRKYERIPLELLKTKPFVKTGIVQGEQKIFINMLLDTGASHAALLDFNQIEDMEPPEKVVYASLGRGIAGEIPGSIGRLDKIKIKEFEFENVLISIPDEGVYNSSIKRGSRQGTIGGEFLRRFDVAFDYHKERIYLKKSNYFKESFEFDMSGMELNVTGEDLDTLRAIKVYKGRPAYKAGIRQGDVIISINGKSIENNRLSDFYNVLRRKEGDLMKVRYSRGGDGIVRKARFYLERRI